MNAKVGDIVIPDKGYAYYGFERELASRFCGDKLCMLEVITPKGAKISRNMEHGGEAVFPRNAEYKLLSIDKTPIGQTRIVLEYILPKT